MTCDDALCGGTLDGPVGGHYRSDNVLELFKPSFESGTHTWITETNDGWHFNKGIFSREQWAVQAIAHEAAHSIGVDINKANGSHFKANYLGAQARSRFEKLYGY